MNPQDLQVLREVVEATNAQTISFQHQTAVANLVAAGYVELNAAMTQPDGRVACRATPTGAGYYSSIAQSQPAAPVAPFPAQANAPVSMTTAPVAPPMMGMPQRTAFVIQKGVPLPERKVKKAKVSSRVQYPFADMVEGDSFFVQLDTTDKSKVRSVAAASSSASKKFKGVGKSFVYATTAEPVVEGGAAVTGVRVYCVKPEPSVDNAAPAA